MGSVSPLKKATIQVKSTLGTGASATTSSKTADILNEGGNYEVTGGTLTGDALLVSNFVTALYAQSRRTVASINVIGTSGDIA